MDEGTLNDLLECSVCLERLDTSSKVLPCQHTFCKKCLHEIVDSHKELRCPECRILVPCKVDELPPNVLLMRILEGMKNAAPKRNHRSGIHHQHPQNTTPIHQAHLPHTPHTDLGTPGRHKSNKHHASPQISQPQQSYAKALYDYAPLDPMDLSFHKGDTIVVHKRVDNNWMHGECGGKRGLFPLTYVQIVTPLPSHIPQCKALYDFRMDNDEEEGCLRFRKGDILTVIRRVDENWAEGKLDGRIGIFPLPFVELNNLARSLMKLSTNSQPGPSRLAPPTPTTDDNTPLIPTDHSRDLVNNTIQSLAAPSTTTADSSSATTTSGSCAPNTSACSNTPPPSSSASSSVASSSSMGNSLSSSSSSSVPSSPASPPPRTGQNGVPTGAPVTYVALFPYKPQKPDELELRKGGIYLVTERCQDGWFKGTSNRTQKCGVFPGNYVALARGGIATGPLTSTTSSITSGGILPATITAIPSAIAIGSNTAAARLLHLEQKQQQMAAASAAAAATGKSGCHLSARPMPPPELPPRSASPATLGIGDLQQQQQQPPPRLTVKIPVRNKDQHHPRQPAQQPTQQPSSTSTPPTTPPTTNNAVSLMRRLASMKRSKSPQPQLQISDQQQQQQSANVLLLNPAAASSAAAVHVRSGSCPSQLQPMEQQGGGGGSVRMHFSSSQRLKHKERPSVAAMQQDVVGVHATPMRCREEQIGPLNTSLGSAVPFMTPSHHAHAHHRKSQSLDATNHHNQGPRNATNPTTPNSQTNTPVRERYRCIAPYPPNSDYELELHVGDVVYVHRKREDGWFKGAQPRTGRTGLFPASFVEPHP